MGLFSTTYSNGLYKIDEKSGTVVVISPCFAMFNNVVHNLESGETPSKLASRQALNYVQRS